MDNSTIKILLASTGASFVLGFGTAWIIQSPATSTPVVMASAQPDVREALQPVNQTAGVSPGIALPGPTAGAILPQHATVDELWAKALLPQDKQQAGFDAEDRLRKMAQTNPVALRSLLNRYSGMQSPQARELLKSILSTVQTPEVVAFSTRLAGSSNVAERKYGFEMLQGVAPDAPETRSLVSRTLANEQSPEVLLQALSTLQSAAGEPEETAQMVTQLNTLSHHADVGVRAQSIQQLGQWDKRGEGADRLAQALTDRAPEVRQAAIFAIAQAGIRSDDAKTALLGLVNNAQESRDMRGSALQALERFALSKEEYAGVAQARVQFLGL